MSAPSPYRGLAAFDDSDVDALYFFGRERDSEIVVANLIASRLTVLYGPSGVGKSSLLLASVARTLRMLPEQPLVVVFSSWSEAPEQGLARAIADAAGIEHGRLLDVTTMAQAGRDVYVILDQAEEYFTYHDGDDGFDRALARLVDGSLRVNVLLSLREDALASLDRLKGAVPNLFGNVLRLDRLDRASGHAAIVKPLERWSELEGDRVTIEEDLVGDVLDGVGAGRIELGPGGQGSTGGNGRPSGIEAPYLQLVMQRIWDVERANGSAALRATTLVGLGGARQVVADHLERAIEALTPSERDIAALLFEHLVTPSGTKIAHAASDLAQLARAPERDVSRVVAVLSEHRILRTDESGRWEIFHDVLASAVLGWKTRHEATQAVQRARVEARRRQRRLGFVAVLSLAGVALAGGLAAWALDERQNARKQATAALAAERSAAEQAVLARRARQDAQRQATAATRAGQRAIDRAAAARRAQRAAAASRARAEISARAARVAEARALEQASIARAERDRADDQAAAARASGRRASAAAAAAGVARRRAERAADTAQQAAVAARARERAAVAQSLLATDPEGALRAALDSLALDPTSPVEGVLREGLLRSRVLDVLPGGGGELVAVFPEAGVDNGPAASPVGRDAVVTVSRQGVVRVFSRRRGTLLRAFATGSTSSCAALAPDRITVALGGPDGVVRVYSTVSGETVRVLNHIGPVLSVGFSPDGRLLASAGNNETAKLWDVATGGLIRRLEHPRAVRSVSFSADSTRLVTLSSDRFVRLFDTATGRLAARVDQTETPTGAVFSPDGHALLTTGQEEVPRIWDADSGALLRKLEGHSGIVFGAAYAPGGDKVATASSDGTARVWNPETGQLLLQLIGHSSFVDAVSFSPDGTRVLTASRDGTARLWNGVTGALQASFLGHRGRVTAAVFAQDGTWAATASDDGTARTWSITSDPELRQIASGDGPIVDLAVSRRAERVAVARGDGAVEVYTGEGRPVTDLHLGTTATSVALSNDGSRVLATGSDGTVSVWEVSDGVSLARFTNGAPVTSGVFLPNGEGVVVGGSDGIVRWWDLGSKRARIAAREPGPVTDVAVGPDAVLLATAVGEEARVRPFAGGGRVVRLSGHRDTVTSVEFSSDAGRLVTASFDHDVMVWDVRTGERAKTFIGHVAVVRGASFSEDGRWVVTAGPTRAGLWEVGKSSLVDSRLYYLAGHRGALRAVAFSATGWRVYSGGADGTLRRYDCRLCGGQERLRHIVAAKLDRLTAAAKR